MLGCAVYMLACAPVERDDLAGFLRVIFCRFWGPTWDCGPGDPRTRTGQGLLKTTQEGQLCHSCDACSLAGVFVYPVLLQVMFELYVTASPTRRRVPEKIGRLMPQTAS